MCDVNNKPSVWLSWFERVMGNKVQLDDKRSVVLDHRYHNCADSLKNEVEGQVIKARLHKNKNKNFVTSSYTLAFMTCLSNSRTLFFK